jgi:hypothetical protein
VRAPPFYVVGATISTPVGRGVVRAVHRSTRADEYLVEIAYDNRRGIFTYLESELRGLVVGAPAATHYTPGEVVHTPAGEVIIRKLHDRAQGLSAEVEDLRTGEIRTVSLVRPTPPLEAA